MDFQVDHCGIPLRSPITGKPPSTSRMPELHIVLKRQKLEKAITEICEKERDFAISSLRDACSAIINEDWQNKMHLVFQCLDFELFVRENEEACRHVTGVKELLEAITFLIKYGINLLRPVLPKMWHFISFDSPTYRSKLRAFKGKKRIFHLYGYTKELSYGLSYSNVDAPNTVTVTKVVADMAIAYFDIECTIKGTHPSPRRLVDLILNGPTEKTYDEAFKSKSSPISTLAFHQTASSLGSENTVTSDVKSTQQLINHGNKLDDQSAKNNPMAWTNDNTKMMTPLLPKQIQDLNLDICGLCKQNHANMKCELCSQARCTRCDEIWHKHPSRRNHRRHDAFTIRDLQEIPSSRAMVNGQHAESRGSDSSVTSHCSSVNDPIKTGGASPIPKLPVAAKLGDASHPVGGQAISALRVDADDAQSTGQECDFCGKQEGRFFCPDCDELYCPECDDKRHRMEKRKNHERMQRQINQQEDKITIQGEDIDEVSDFQLSQRVATDSLQDFHSAVSFCNSEDLDVRAPPKDQYQIPQTHMYREANGTKSMLLLGGNSSFSPSFGHEEEYESPTYGHSKGAGPTTGVPKEGTLLARKQMSLEAEISKIVAEDIHIMETVDSLRDLKHRETDPDKKKELTYREKVNWQKHIELQVQQRKLEGQLRMGTSKNGEERESSSGSNVVASAGAITPQAAESVGVGHSGNRVVESKMAVTAQNVGSKKPKISTSSSFATANNKAICESDGWTCEHCTFMNTNESTNICEICHKTSTQRPKSQQTLSQGKRLNEQAECTTTVPVGKPSTERPERRSNAEYFQKLEAEMLAEKKQAREQYEEKTDRESVRPHRTPSRKPVDRSGSLTDRMLFEVAEQIPPESFFALGLELGLSGAELSRFQSRSTVMGNAAFEMLRMWRDRVHGCEQRRALQEALKESKLRMLAQMLEVPAYFQAAQAQVSSTESFVTDEELVQLADKISVDSLAALGLYLGFDDAQLDAYTRDNRNGTQQILLDWKNKTRASDQRRDLNQVLETLGLPQLASNPSKPANKSPVSEEEMYELADSLNASSITKLGMYLGFSGSDLALYQHTAPKSPREGTMRMLSDWKTNVAGSVQRDLLSAALMQSGHRRFAEKIRNSLVDPQSQYRDVSPKVDRGPARLSHNQQHDFDDVLRHISQDLVDAEDIEALGKELGFSTARIYRFCRMNYSSPDITHRGALSMLREWRRTVPVSEERSSLRQALIKAHLVWIADDHLPQDKFKYHQPGASEERNLSDVGIVADRQLAQLAKHIPLDCYNSLATALGITFANSHKILSTHLHDSGMATLQILRHWKVRTGGSKGDLDLALLRAGCGGLVQMYKTDTWDHSPIPGDVEEAPLTHATSFGDLSYVHDEQKRRHEDMRAASLQLVAVLREGETIGIPPARIECAMKHMDDPDGDVLQWVNSHWPRLVREVAQRATAELRENLEVDVDVAIAEMVAVSEEQAGIFLENSRGDKDAAVKECIHRTQQKIIEIVRDDCFATDEIAAALKEEEIGGNMDKALDVLQTRKMSQFTERIWGETAVDENEFFRAAVEEDDRSVRMLMVEYHMRSWGRAQTAVKLIKQTEYNVDDIVLAAEECGDLRRSKEFLNQECTMCMDNLPRNKLMSLINCQCMICRQCMTQHFEIIARDMSIMKSKCPNCLSPDLDDPAVAADYFAFLDILLRDMLSDEVYALFQRKLRDWNLMQDPAFCWCAHCNSGFINGAPDRRKMRCPECNKLTCFLCKKQWLDQHEGISCEQFQMWKEQNDPDMQAQGLAAHLNENGIACPRCKMRYELAKGGCMHFRCPQCTFEFCCGCNQPIKKGEVCGKFLSCPQKGLHAHHPRDCLFYLRDMDVPTLQQLLEAHEVKYNKDPPAGALGNEAQPCGVMEQKESPDGLQDDKCGRPVSPGNAGLCGIHYKEYLVGLINANDIDPAKIFTVEQLKASLVREEIEPLTRREGEPDVDYRRRLVMEVQRQLPLNKFPVGRFR